MKHLLLDARPHLLLLALLLAWAAPRLAYRAERPAAGGGPYHEAMAGAIEGRQTQGKGTR
jgi:hypothetical protein